MTTFNQSHFIDTNSSLVTLLDQLPDGIDSDFDNDLDDLERQFAEIRLTFSHI